MFSISKQRNPYFAAPLHNCYSEEKAHFNQILASTRRSSILQEQIWAAMLHATEKVKSGGKKNSHFLGLAPA